MARRKTPRAARRRAPAKRGGIQGRARKASARLRKASARQARLRKASTRQARVRKSSTRQARVSKASKKQARVRKSSARLRKASARQARLRKTSARQARVSKTSARLRKPSARQARVRVASANPAKKAPGKAARRPAQPKATVRAAQTAVVTRATQTAASRPASGPASLPIQAKRPSRPAFAARKAPAGLNRERRIVADEDVVPTPPSSLDLDRTASAARTGRRELHERFVEHTETGPVLTGGDIDADWESAYSVGDEAPGGDNPTPDQDIVDDIGKAVGIEYEDNEELKGEKKVAERDRKRWELDPASSEDYNDR